MTTTSDSSIMDTPTSGAQEISPTIEDYKKTAPPASGMESYVKGAQDFVRGTLQRTGTLYESTRDAVVKRTGSIYSSTKEGVSQGLKRSGTMYESAREGMSEGLKRSGTVVEGAREGLLKRSSTFGASVGAARAEAGGVLMRTGSFFQETGGLVYKRTGSWFEGTNKALRGYFDPNKPLHANIREINGVTLGRVGASIAVIDGRAYIFGGEDEKGHLVDNTMHVVILPASSAYEADYTTVFPKPKVAGGQVPDGRKNHSAVVVGTSIYIFGGQLGPKAKEEAGRVWVFDTKSRRWSFHDPAADAPYPQPRHSHAAVASDEPGPAKSPEGTVDVLEQDEDPSRTVPEPVDEDTWGTFFIHGGKVVKEGGEETLNDVWAFDIATRTWFTLPPAPTIETMSSGAVLAVSQGHLVRVCEAKTEGEMQLRVDNLDVSELFKVHQRGDAFNKVELPSLLSEWSTTMFPDGPLGGSLCVANVSSPNGKEYLLLFAGAGMQEASTEDEKLLPAMSGIVALEVTVGGLTRAQDPEAEDVPLVKRMLKVDPTFVDAYGDPVESGSSAQKRLEGRTAFAFASGSEADGSHLVIWGGKNGNGGVSDDGYMITVEF